MIREDIMVKIAERYFERQKIKPIRQKTGPDFLLEGKAIEVKGSNSKFNYALSQFWDYTLKYRGLMTIFPTDFLSTPSRLFNFHLFCNLALSLAQRYIEVVLVCKDDDFYYLKELTGHVLLGDVASYIADEKKGINEIFRNLNSYIQKATTKVVKENRNPI